MSKLFNIFSTFFIVSLLAIVSCSGGEMEQNKKIYSSLDDVPDAVWEKLNKRTFYL